MRSFDEGYKTAEVDVTAGYCAVKLVKSHVARTATPGMLSGLDDFGGLSYLDLSGMKEPVLVPDTDGVSAKLRLTFLTGQYGVIGIDCVAMCVNSVICGGAQPLSFLDYLAVGKSHPEKTEKIIAGVTKDCVWSGRALVGDETVETSGFYLEGGYDSVGFYAGMVDHSKIIDGSQMQPDDVILGLGSSGAYSSGFSLIRKVFRLGSGNVGHHTDELSKTLGEGFLAPTRVYIRSVLNLMEQCGMKAISHITGGSFYENVPCTMKEGLTVKLEEAVLPSLPIFHLLQSVGNIPEHDVYSTFNMGIGMCPVVFPEEADKAAALLRETGERVPMIGQVGQDVEGVVLC